MKRKFNLKLKKINLKDRKYIFPIIIFCLVLVIGWFIYGIINDLNKNSKSEKEQQEVTELQSIPSGVGQELNSKSKAMEEAFRATEEYTAVQGIYDPTIINSDTTIYTEKEIAYLDSLERVMQYNQADIEAINEEILRGNQELSESRRGLGAVDLTNYNSNPNTNSVSSTDNELLNEMIMYQKLINGEEILTPEEESRRREEQIREDERLRVLDEINKTETNVVEKVENINSSVFNTPSSSSSKNGEQSVSHNTFKAMVDQTVKVEQGSRIRFALLEDVKIGEHIIKSGTHIYGIVSGFSEQRIIADINTIIINGEHVKVNLSVLDVDGIPGLYVPRSAFRDATKQAASQAVQGGQFNINSSPDNFTGMAAQAVQSAYQSVSQAVSSNISKTKATVKYNTIVYLTNSK